MPDPPCHNICLANTRLYTCAAARLACRYTEVPAATTALCEADLAHRTIRTRHARYKSTDRVYAHDTLIDCVHTVTTVIAWTRAGTTGGYAGTYSVIADAGGADVAAPAAIVRIFARVDALAFATLIPGRTHNATSTTVVGIMLGVHALLLVDAPAAGKTTTLIAC